MKVRRRDGIKSKGIEYKGWADCGGRIVNAKWQRHDDYKGKGSLLLSFYSFEFNVDREDYYRWEIGYRK